MVLIWFQSFDVRAALRHQHPSTRGRWGHRHSAPRLLRALLWVCRTAADKPELCISASGIYWSWRLSLWFWGFCSLWSGQLQVKVSEKRPGTGSQRCVRGSTRSAWLAFIILLCVPSELCLEQKYCSVETIDLTKAVVKDKTNFLWFLSSRTVNSWKVSKLHCSSYFSSYV